MKRLRKPRVGRVYLLIDEDGRLTSRAYPTRSIAGAQAAPGDRIASYKLEAINKRPVRLAGDEQNGDQRT